MKWKSKHITLGEVKVGKRKLIVFSGLEDLPAIRSLTSTCGCSSPKREDNNILVTFVPKPVPLHLVKLGHYITTERIKITYMDGTQETLSFTAKVIKN